MPCEFLIDTNRRLVISRGTGTFRYADFLQHFKKLAKDPRFQRGFDHIVDCRKFDRFDVTTTEVYDIGSQSLFAAKSKRAFVVSSEVHFGLGRMFATFRQVASGQETTVFREMGDAIAWLGLPPEYEPSDSGRPQTAHFSSSAQKPEVQDAEE